MSTVIASRHYPTVRAGVTVACPHRPQVERRPGGIPNSTKCCDHHCRPVHRRRGGRPRRHRHMDTRAAVTGRRPAVDRPTDEHRLRHCPHHRGGGEVDYGPLYYVIGLAVIIMIASYIWVGKLRREVSKRVQAETKANIASQAKSDFLASMSHDLRTPLNAIIGFSETLLQGTFGPIKNKKNVEYINDIHSSGEYLLHLVNDILDLSALEADQRELNYESFDGEQLTLECKNIVFKLAEDKNIDIAINNTEKLPNVYADKKAVKQILMNLVTNSIKFTPPNGNITISHNVSDDNYFFQISDTGWGISEEAIKIIDRPFTRAEPSALISHEEGTGLGLSIVKSLVDVHGGELNIESIVGEGTTVTISLPLQNTAKLS